MKILAAAVHISFAAVLFAQGGFNGAGRYEITNVKSGRVIDLDRNDQSTVIQFSPRGTDNQVWDIQPAPNGFFYIRNSMNGYALDAGRARNSEPLRGAPFNGGPGQQWRFETGKDGNVLIMSRLGKTIDVPDGTDRDGARLQVYDPNGDSNQRFMLRRVAGPRGGGFGAGRGPDRGRDDRGGPGSIVCASNNGERVYCAADTGAGVQLIRQISGSPCREGNTWGWDRRGIWVDRGCRGEFSVTAGGSRGGFGSGNNITCASNNGERVYCDVDTRGRNVQMIRQISGSPCRQGETWGWDRRGIWVDRGCRAEFAVR